MSSAAVIRLAVQASLFLMVLGVGLQSTRQDTTYLLRHRALLARSFLSMNVIMPLVALSFAMLFSLRPAIKLALVALALSPVPPFLPNRAAKAGGHDSYMTALLVTASLAAIVIIPASVWILGRLFGGPFHMSAMPIVKLVGAGALVPLAVGIGIGGVAPGIAARAARPVAVIALIVLVAALIPILIKLWPAMRSLIGDGTVIAILVMTLVGLAVGHVLGGPEPEDRTVLALATCCRHPAIAIAILAATFPDNKLAPAAVLLALLVGAIASTPYTVWRRQRSREWRPAPSRS